MTAAQNSLQFQDLNTKPVFESEASFSIGGRTFSVSLGGEKDGIKESFLLEGGINTKADDDELLDDLNHLLARGSRSTQVDLKNHAAVTLPDGIAAKFIYNQFDVCANSRYADQIVQIPLDKMYEAHGKTYVFKGTELILPYATISYPDGGTTNFINCPVKVSQDTEISVNA